MILFTIVFTHHATSANNSLRKTIEKQPYLECNSILHACVYRTVLINFIKLPIPFIWKAKCGLAVISYLLKTMGTSNSFYRLTLVWTFLHFVYIIKDMFWLYGCNPTYNVSFKQGVYNVICLLRLAV